MNTTVSVLIVEDEAIWAKQLEIYLQNLGYTISAVFATAADALVNIEKINFDIALLDIRMNGLNAGISIGKMIHQMYQKPFIFITSGNDKDTVDEAIAAKPSAFLIKPVNETSLYVAIQTAIDNYSQNKQANALNEHSNTDNFFVKNGSAYKKIDWKNVVALSVEGRYTKVITQVATEHYMIGSSLNKTTSVIIPKHLQQTFTQINRTQVINTQHIQQLKADELITAQQSFSVSENYMHQLKQILNIV